MTINPNNYSPQVVEHSVATDVREDDIYKIHVKYADVAHYAESGAEIEQLDKNLGDDEIKFKIENAEKIYYKKINNVAKAETAIYDTRGRRLSQMANEATYKQLVDAYLDGKNYVTSVNGYGGNVLLTKADIELGNVDNTSDEDKPFSRVQREFNEYIDNKYKPGDGILFTPEVIEGELTGHVLIENNFDTQPLIDRIEQIEYNVKNPTEWRLIDNKYPNDYDYEANNKSRRFDSQSWVMEYSSEEGIWH